MNISSWPSNDDKLETINQDLVERFLAAYNTIDRELRHRLGVSYQMAFSEIVRDYAKRYPFRAYEKELQTFGDLRNFIAHTKTEPYRNLAIPTLKVIERIEQIRESFQETVIPKFSRPVKVVRPTDQLSDVLILIKNENFSQIPVYGTDQRFQGLLTENGITRWLAHNTIYDKKTAIFENVTVQTVLFQEEQRHNCLILSRNTPVQIAISEFSKSSFLEAMLFTHSGKENEIPLGIATRWDIPETK